MILKIKAGKDPADKNQIKLFAGKETIENIKILSANNDHGRKYVTAVIEYREGDEKIEYSNIKENKIYSKMEQQPKSSKK